MVNPLIIIVNNDLARFQRCISFRGQGYHNRQLRVLNLFKRTRCEFFTAETVTAGQNRTLQCRYEGTLQGASYPIPFGIISASKYWPHYFGHRLLKVYKKGRYCN